MNEKQLAEKIVELVGGEGNIVSVRHCATRLRIVVSDKDQIETDAVEALDRVKGSFFNSGQYQIILGTGLVNRVYDEVIKITGGAESGEKKETVVYGNRFQRAIRMFSDVFVPILVLRIPWRKQEYRRGSFSENRDETGTGKSVKGICLRKSHSDHGSGRQCIFLKSAGGRCCHRTIRADDYGALRRYHFHDRRGFQSCHRYDAE